MTSTLPRRTAAVTALAVAAFSGVAIAGAAVSTAAAHRAHTTLSIRANHSSINPGGGDFISGQLRSPKGDTAGRQVALLDKAIGATGWTKEAVHRTGAQGHVGFAVSPTATTRYRLAFGGDAQLQHSRSGVVTVRVLNTTSLTIAVADATINPGDSDTVSGVLSLDGAPLAGDTVNLMGRHDKSGNKLIGSSTTASDGSVSFSVTPAVTTHYVLVFKQTAGDAGARSAVATIRVLSPSTLSIRARFAQHKDLEVISGDLRGNGHGLVHRPIMLQARPDGTSTWATVATKSTGKGGNVSFSVTASSSPEDYQLVFAGGGLYSGCQSGVVTTPVS